MKELIANDINKLTKGMQNATTPFMFYWMLAILDFAKRGEIDKPIPYHRLTARMLAKAWGPLMEHGHSLGKQDMISDDIHEIIFCSPLSKCSLEENIIQHLETNKNSKWYKKIVDKLTKYVPERLLYPWIGTCTSAQAVTMSAKKENRCLYALSGKKTIVVNRLWREYLEMNATILEGFVYQHLHIYLEKRNKKQQHSSANEKGKKGAYTFNNDFSIFNGMAAEPSPLKKCVEEKTSSTTVNNTFIKELNINGNATVLGDVITDNGKKINNIFFKQ